MPRYDDEMPRKEWKEHAERMRAAMEEVEKEGTFQGIVQLKRIFPIDDATEGNIADPTDTKPDLKKKKLDDSQAQDEPKAGSSKASGEISNKKKQETNEFDVPKTMPGMNSNEFNVSKTLPGMNSNEFNISKTLPGMNSNEFNVSKTLPGTSKGEASAGPSKPKGVNPINTPARRKRGPRVLKQYNLETASDWANEDMESESDISSDEEKNSGSDDGDESEIDTDTTTDEGEISNKKKQETNGFDVPKTMPGMNSNEFNVSKTLPGMNSNEFNVSKTLPGTSKGEASAEPIKPKGVNPINTPARRKRGPRVLKQYNLETASDWENEDMESESDISSDEEKNSGSDDGDECEIDTDTTTDEGKISSSDDDSTITSDSSIDQNSSTDDDSEDTEENSDKFSEEEEMTDSSSEAEEDVEETPEGKRLIKLLFH